MPRDTLDQLLVCAPPSEERLGGVARLAAADALGDTEVLARNALELAPPRAVIE